MAKDRLVFGVGVNDSGLLTAKITRINGRQVRQWSCPFYATWVDMLRRCYSETHKAGRPAYDGCEVDSAWHLFSAFRSWMELQPWQGNHLDKDILIQGNRIYQADRCVFIPRALNNFLTDRSAARGQWPIGVSFASRRGKFMAQCGNPFTGKGENLGYHATPQEAHAAWLHRKTEHAKKYADMQTDHRIACALLERFGIQ